VMAIISVSICSTVLFSLLGLINGIYAKKFDDVNIIPTFILTPLIYLGGVFYSITLLPKNWQYITFVNPITYIINAFRFGILGVSDLNITVTFIFLCLFIVILFIFALYLVKTSKGLRF